MIYLTWMFRGTLWRGRGGVRWDESEPSLNDADAECYGPDSILLMRPYLYA